MTIIVYIDHTGRTSKQPGYIVFDKETRRFADMSDAHKWLKETYKGQKRDKIYRDNPDGIAKQIGWAIHLGRQRDWSHSAKDWRWQQDWVEFWKEMPIKMNKKRQRV